MPKKPRHSFEPNTSQTIRADGIAPEVLPVVVSAFNAAWDELAPDMGTDPKAILRARSILAKIVLGLAKVGPIDQNMLKSKSLVAYQVKSGDMSCALSSVLS